MRYVKEGIVGEIGNGMFEGELKIMYSSFGEIFCKSWVVRVKNKNKDVEY